MDCIPAGNTTTCALAGSSSEANNKRKENKKGGKKSKGVMKLSTDPQSVAARERRHRISDRFKILQSMVPGGSKMDTVSMLEEAIHYVKFLKAQIWLHQTMMMNFVYDDSNSSMFLPDQYNFPSEQIIPLQQNPSVETLPQLPLAQCCIQGEGTTIDATLTYWPA